jgi:hypothetical protein
MKDFEMTTEQLIQSARDVGQRLRVGTGGGKHWMELEEEGADAIANLIAALEAAEKDAKRYRFIRDVPYTAYLHHVISNQQNKVMDAAIDAAMQGKTK